MNLPKLKTRKAKPSDNIAVPAFEGQPLAQWPLAKFLAFLPYAGKELLCGGGDTPVAALAHAQTRIDKLGEAETLKQLHAKCGVQS